MATIIFTIEIEDVDHQDFNITDSEAQEILDALEETVAKRSYSLYDSAFERC